MRKILFLWAWLVAVALGLTAAEPASGPVSRSPQEAAVSEAGEQLARGCGRRFFQRMRRPRGGCGGGEGGGGCGC